MLGAGGLQRIMRSCVEAGGSSDGCGSSPACAWPPSAEDVRAALARAARGSPGGGIASRSASRLLRFALGFSGVSSSPASNGSASSGSGAGSGSSSSAGNCDSTMASASLWGLSQRRSRGASSEPAPFVLQHVFFDALTQLIHRIQLVLGGEGGRGGEHAQQRADFILVLMLRVLRLRSCCEHALAQGALCRRACVITSRTASSM